MDNVIDTYHDSMRFSFDRWTVLKSDRIELRCHNFRGPRWEQTVLLKNCEPEPIRQFARTHYFHWAGLATLLLVPWSLVEVWNLVFYPGAPIPQVCRALFFIILGIASVIALLWTSPYVEHLQYLSCHGVGLISVTRCGPDAARFDEFCEKLQARVEACQPPERTQVRAAGDSTAAEFGERPTTTAPLQFETENPGSPDE